MNTVKLKPSENPFNIAKSREFELIKGMPMNNFCHAQRICPLSNPPPLPHPLCQVLKVLLIKICKIQSPDLLFLFVFISFCVSSYYFSKTFRTSFNNIRKNIFITNFSFSMDSLRSPHPLNSRNPLNVTKVFCQCSLSHMTLKI